VIARAPVAVVASLLAACATFSGPTGRFSVRCNVPEASVLVDDVLLGPASEWAPPGRPIRPGFHRVEIRHPGYFSHFAEIEMTDGGRAVVAANLHPLLD
jgi:hypothetical protein